MQHKSSLTYQAYTYKLCKGWVWVREEGVVGGGDATNHILHTQCKG